MRYITAALVTLFIFTGFIQTGFSQSKAKGQITGVILDGITKSPIEHASVSLLKDSVVITGTETQANGEFTLNNISNGTYDIRISMIGYAQKRIKNIVIDSDNNIKSLNEITLSGDISTEEIEVEAEKSAIEFHADKKIFNVEKTLNTQGGNALDVLKNLPSVSVDNDGNVSLRGSQNVKILIDGKPSGLDGQNRSIILQQLPSSQIENVELITSPSAKYDAEGVSGIINIILKKSDIFGYNGSIMLNAGTKDKYNSSINFNLRKNNFNFFGSYDYRLYNTASQGEESRNNILTSALTNSNTDGSFRMNVHFLKTGFDYTIDKKNSISLAVNYNHRERKNGSTSNYIFTDIVNGTSSLRNLTKNDGSGNSLDATLSYTRKFDKEDQRLDADLIFSKFSDNLNSSVGQNISALNPILQNQTTNTDFKNLIFQMDYSHPFANKNKLETGVKFTYRDNDRDYQLLNYDYTIGGYVNDPLSTNTFKYKEQIYAAYATYSGKINNFSYNIGLRGEGAVTNGNLVTTGETFDNKYFDLFPSVSLSQKLGKEEDIQFSYSRRINRPNSWILNPFKYVQDPLTVYSGNPGLKPEYTNSFELSFIKYISTTVITPSVYFRQTNDMMSFYQTINDSNVALTTYRNFAKSKTYGAELVVNSTLFRFWNLNGNLNYFKSKIDASNVENNLSNDNYSWSARLISSMRLPNIFDLQITYFYSGKMLLAQGYVDPFQSMDVSIKRDFFDNKLTVGVRAQDIFDSMRFKVHGTDRNRVVDINQKFNQQAVFLTLTYKFGVMDTSKKDKRRKATDDTNNNQQTQPGQMGF